MPRLALGLIETIGLAAAIEAADTAVKSANVSLLGYELSKGGGMVTVKIEGDVGAVKAAVEAGCIAAEKVSSVWSRQVIPRPHDEVSKIVVTKETVGYETEEESPAPQKELVEEPVVEEPVAEESVFEKTVEAPVSQEEVETDSEEITEDKEDNGEVCNLCKDPKCPRKKGDLRTTCIHYEELKEGQ